MLESSLGETSVRQSPHPLAASFLLSRRSPITQSEFEVRYITSRENLKQVNSFRVKMLPH